MLKTLELVFRFQRGFVDTRRQFSPCPGGRCCTRQVRSDESSDANAFRRFRQACSRWTMACRYARRSRKSSLSSNCRLCSLYSRDSRSAGRTGGSSNRKRRTRLSLYSNPIRCQGEDYNIRQAPPCVRRFRLFEGVRQDAPRRQDHSWPPLRNSDSALATLAPEGCRDISLHSRLLLSGRIRFLLALRSRCVFSFRRRTMGSPDATRL